MLEVNDLWAGYGSIEAVRGVSLRVGQNQVIAVIGANGAGKSTTLNTICGLMKPRQGSVTFLDKDITGWPAHKVVATGLMQVPEGRHILAPLTVEDNLRMGAYLRRDREVDADMEGVYQRFPVLKARRRQLGGSLSGGEQQMLAIARALMARPKLLLLDEPSMGLSPILVDEVFSIVGSICEAGTSILLVEQNADRALELASYTYVMERGHIVREGVASEVRLDERVIEAYLS